MLFFLILISITIALGTLSMQALLLVASQTILSVLVT